MKEVQLLKERLTLLLGWNQARIDFLAKFLIALLDAQTINLTRIAQKFKGKAKVSSHYKRLQRFFRSFHINPSLFAQAVVLLMPFGQQWLLCLDRTNWKFGKTHINFLVLGVAYRGVCFPLFWMLLPNAGCSDTRERIELMERFLGTFPAERIEALTADREFIGKIWTMYLIDRQIPFCLRIKSNTKVVNPRNGKEFRISRMFADLHVEQSKVLRKPRLVWGISVYVVALRTKKDFVFLITSERPQRALAKYRKRWDIETLFSCLKTRGFCLEDTHMKERERLSRLFGVMSLALCWCFLQGEALSNEKNIPVKKHGRKAMSIFRLGLDHIANAIANISIKIEAFRQSLCFLSCT